MLLLKTVAFKVVESHLKHGNQLRFYTRWSHRRPRRVLTPEEYDKIENMYKANQQISKEIPDNDEKIIELNPEADLIQRQQDTRAQRKWAPETVKSSLGLINMAELDEKSQAVSYKIEQKVAKKKKPVYKTKSDVSKSTGTTDMLETVIDANGDFVYTKLKDKDPVVAQLLITAKSRKEQIKKDLALLEGKRLIKEALEANCTLKNLIFSRKSDVEYLKPYLPKSGAKLYKMPYREIQMWSDLTTTPGIMGIFKTPDVQNFVPKASLPLTIICDNIREPGNLGAVLRTVAGVGAHCVILTKGCVDLWDTKVLRSACGAHFCLQIHKKMEWPEIRNHISTTGSSVLIADNKIVSESATLGSQFSQDQQEPHDSSDADNAKSLTDIVMSLPLLPYYSVRFCDVGHMALVVGGETEGISEESYRLADSFNGIRLNIPLSNSVDSLNTGTALGIIIFEIKRQLSLLRCKSEADISI